MKIALLGYGNMGRKIHALADEQGLSVPVILTRENNKNGTGINLSALSEIDVAIDFSTPELAPLHIEKLLELGKPVVAGTTGWFESRRRMEELCEAHEGKVLYGSNFSLGVQLFIRLIARAGELFGKDDSFDAALHEVHHTKKADAPGGTAKTMADAWLKSAGKKKKPDFDIPKTHKIDEDHFYVTSQRLGSVYGEHQLRINSSFDDIELTHRARSRDAFASGALRAAGWLLHQKPGFYLIEEIVEDL